MSALQQLRELLQPDIEQMVEKRLEERLPGIIEVLMPSILEHVANSLSVVTTLSHGVHTPSLRTAQLVMDITPGFPITVGNSFNVIDKHFYNAKWENINDELFRLQQKLANLESKLP